MDEYKDILYFEIEKKEEEEINKLKNLEYKNYYGIFLILSFKNEDLEIESKYLNLIYKKKLIYNNKKCIFYIFITYKEISFQLKYKTKNNFINNSFYSNSYKFNGKENKIEFIINPKFNDNENQNDIYISKYDEIKLLYNIIKKINDNDNKDLKLKLIFNLIKKNIDKFDYTNLNLFEYLLIFNYCCVENYTNDDLIKNFINNFKTENIIISEENIDKKINEIKINSDIFYNVNLKNLKKFKNLKKIEIYYYFLKENFNKFFDLIKNEKEFIKDSFKKNKYIQNKLNEKFYQNILIENEYKNNLNDEKIIILNLNDLETTILLINFENGVNLINKNIEKIKNIFRY